MGCSEARKVKKGRTKNHAYVGSIQGIGLNNELYRHEQTHEITRYISLYSVQDKKNKSYFIHDKLLKICL